LCRLGLNPIPSTPMFSTALAPMAEPVLNLSFLTVVTPHVMKFLITFIRVLIMHQVPWLIEF
jgi:hypothetical protein